MKTDRSIRKLLFGLTLLVLATVFCMSLFLGSASAQVVTTTSATSLSGYDKTAPLVTRVDAKKSSDNKSHVVEADFLDAESEIDTDSEGVSVPDAFVSGCQKTDRKISCSATGLKAGKHKVHVSVKDRSGNRKDEEHEVTVTDTDAPIIDSVSATAAGVSVKYHDPSPSSGIASVSVYLDGIKLNCLATGDGGCDNDHDGYDGDHDGYDNDRDDYDNDHDGYDDDHDGSDEDHESYYYDSSSIRHKSDGDYKDTDDDRDGSGSTGFSCPIVGGLTCGDHEVKVVVADKAGNSTTSTTTVNSGADCTPPVTTDNAPAGWQNTDVNVTLTCTDAGSGCASTTYEVDGGATQAGNMVSLTADGIHTITYRSTDNAGNLEATNTATVMIDKTPPDVTTSGDMTVEAAGPAGAAADFASSATDALSGVVGGTSCTPASGSTFPLGTTTVSCSATDAAGNNGTATFTVTVVDSTGPVVTYGGPNGTVITNDSPTINGTATDDVGVVSASVSIDGGAATDCIVDGLGNVSCPTAGVDFGYHSAVITATDAAGNTGSATGFFCKSSGAPHLEIICPTIPPFPSADFYWKDKPNRVMTIVYTLRDDVSPGAYNVQITASSGSSNAGPLVCLTPMPRLVGDVLQGSPVKVALDYYWPLGVTSFSTVVTACADDQCGNTYWEAPPGIPAT